jgi:hypothetical protein
VSDANSVYVVARDANGCVSPASDAVTTTMSSYPSAPVVTPSGSVSICAGDSILLSSDNKGTGTYTWSNATWVKVFMQKQQVPILLSLKMQWM